MNLLQSLQKVNARLDQVPRGFKTAEQWAAEWDLSRPHANKLLVAGTRQNPPLVIMRRFRIANGVGRPYPVPHYAKKK